MASPRSTSPVSEGAGAGLSRQPSAAASSGTRLRLPSRPIHAAGERPPRRAGALHLLPLLAVLLVTVLVLTGCDNTAEVNALSRKAQRQWDEGQFHDAARTYVALTELYPEHKRVEQSLYFAASLYHRFLDDPEQAARYYQQLLVRYPEGDYYYDALESLAQLYAADETTRHRALQLYEQLLRADALQERHDEFAFRIGRLNLEMGRLDQARLALRNLIANHPDSPYRPRAAYLAGYSYYMEDRVPMALAVLRLTAKQFSGTEAGQRATFFVADTLEGQGKFKEALELFQSLRGRYHNESILDERIAQLETRMKKSVR